MEKFKLVFEKQLWHYLALIVFLFVLTRAWALLGTEGGLLGISARAWFCLSIGLAVLHQVYVWFVWRTELHLKLISRTFGDKGFLIYKILFAVLAISRVLVIIPVAIIDRGSLGISRELLYVIAILMLVPVVYLFYSIKKYFTYNRAFGADHFDAAYRSMPLIRQGIFKYNKNAMYVFGLLMPWLPGVIMGSAAAIIIAVFSHVYIWVHYFTLEKPDMKRIYSNI